MRVKHYAVSAPVVDGIAAVNAVKLVSPVKTCDNRDVLRSDRAYSINHFLKTRRVIGYLFKHRLAGFVTHYLISYILRGVFHSDLAAVSPAVPRNLEGFVENSEKHIWMVSVAAGNILPENKAVHIRHIAAYKLSP